MTRKWKRSLTTRAKRCSGTSGSWSKRCAASRASCLVFLDSACARHTTRNYVSADETINEKLLGKYKRNLKKRNNGGGGGSVRDRIEGRCPKFSKNSVECLDQLVSILRGSTRDKPRISKTLLGSFLASMLWLKKREASLSKSVTGKAGEKLAVSDSAVRLICDLGEMVAGLSESASEDDERRNETEKRNSHSLKVSSKAKKIHVESSESESAFDETFATPPPSPPHAVLEVIPNPSVTCMGDLATKDKKKNVSTDTDSSLNPVVAMLEEEAKSTVGYLKGITAGHIIRRIDEKSEKLPEFTVAHTATTGSFEFAVKKQEEPQSCMALQPHPDSSDSLDNLIEFDSDDAATSSLWGGDEMEEFAQTDVVALKSDSKAMQPEPLVNDAPPMVATFKTVKPAFFEVWKYYPKLFIEEVISRTAKIKRGENREMSEQGTASTSQAIALAPGEKQEQEVVIENSDLDLVIYIQVEVEDDDMKEELVLDFERNSFGTQTPNHKNESLVLYETKKSEKYLDNNWSICESLEDEEGCEGGETEESVDVTKVQKDKKVGNVVAFANEVSEVFVKKDIFFKPKKATNAVAVAITIKEGIPTANVYLEQLELHSAYLIERPTPFYRTERNVELEKALELIREIENDVIDTKLSDAILILPRLESELRKHFKHKVKSLGEKDFSKSFDTFFSAFDILPVDVADEADNESSGERLYNLLALLEDLEKAVRASNCSTAVESCGYDSSKIYGLLHALTESIRELEECSNVTSISQTLDIASQVDTAIREFENVVRRTPTEYVAPTSKKNRRRLRAQTSGEMPPKEHLKRVRKKVFEMVEEEAIDTEGRLEKDVDKLDRLERQNDEAMKFMEAFLKKTQRRAAEVATVKTELKKLSSDLGNLHEKLATSNRAKKRAPREEKRRDERELATISRDEIVVRMTGSVKGTVSGLTLALDNLKSRAREKNEACREILSVANLEKEIREHEALSRSSRSSFTAKNVEGVYSWVREFKKIGDHSLYLTWTKPEGAMVDSLIGYEIFVNGKLNQKVRNPQRLQAILYSIDLNQTTEVLLYGLLDNGFRIFLATATYVIS